MLSGSTLLRVVMLFVVAAALAGLVQAFWPQSADAPPPAPTVQRTEPTKASPPKTIAAAPQPRAEPPPAAPQEAPPTSVLPPSPIRPLPRQTAPAGPPEGAGNPASDPPPLPSGRPAAPLADSPPLNAGTSETQQAIDNAGPAAVSVVDLNTASVAELNGLKGGGMIGRAIIQRRPYASVDQLLSKRVLSRSTYERIKNQVTVR